MGEYDVSGLIRKIGDGLLSEGDIERLAKDSFVEHLDKGAVLIREGEMPPAVAFLITGVMRAYILDSAGKDSTDCIASTPGEVLMPYCEVGSMSPVYVEALAASDVLMVGNEAVVELLSSSLGVNRLYNRLLLTSWSYHWEVKRVIRQCRAKERYQWFLRRYPGLADVVPSRCIATYLGMTPVTLSRLRSQMREEGAVA